jgi:hypothetical protein
MLVEMLNGSQIGGSVIAAVSLLCQGLTGLLPVAAMLMIVIAAVIYAAGQVMGAETRARANVWSTACVVGAIMALLIVVISPSVLGTMYGSAVSCTAGPCGGTLCGSDQSCYTPWDGETAHCCDNDQVGCFSVCCAPGHCAGTKNKDGSYGTCD